MHILLIHLFSLFSLAAPIAATGSLASSNPNDASPVLSVNQHGPNRDSVNQTVTGGRRNAITVAVAKASPAVVGINVTETREVQYQQIDPFGMFNDPWFRQFGFGGPARTQKYQVKALDSGFIISADGYILTNDHVAGNASKIIVTTTDGSQYDAKLIGTDHNADITLLKIEGKSNLPYLRFGNSNDLAVGEWAIAMGNPFGLFSINDKPTVTVGVISNTGVNLGLEDGRNYRDMIQTDAAISSGNSGGPLLNANGEVIGMNSVIRSTANSNQGAGSIGLGFAIPVNKIGEVVKRLRAGEKLIPVDLRGLGMAWYDLTDESKEYFHITNDVGVVVGTVSLQSVADKAGIKAGDVIVAIDDEKVRGAQEFQSTLADRIAGENVTFHVQREGHDVNVKLKLPGK